MPGILSNLSTHKLLRGIDSQTPHCSQASEPYLIAAAGFFVVISCASFCALSCRSLTPATGHVNEHILDRQARASFISCSVIACVATIPMTITAVMGANEFIKHCM